MADQIKTKSVGEVSSPAAEEKFAAPQNNESADNTAVGSVASGKKLPVFKNEVEGDNGGGSSPSSKFSLGAKKERVLPVFAAEVNPFENEDESDDFEDDLDPEALVAPFSVDISEVAGLNGQQGSASVPPAVPFDINEYPDPEMPEKSSGKSGNSNIVEGLYGPIEVDSDDPGRLEAAVLLSDYKADKIVRKNAKQSKKKAAVVAAVPVGDFSSAPEAAPAGVDKAAYSDADFEKAYANDLRRSREEALLAENKAQKASKKAQRNQAVAPAAVVEAEAEGYSDAEPYVDETAPVAPLTVAAVPVKANKEFSTENYDNHLSKKERKANKRSARSEKKEEQIAVAGAYVSHAPKASAPAPAPAPEIVYPDNDFSEGYDPDYKANAKAEKARAKAIAEEEKQLMRQSAKRNSADNRNSKNQSRYETGKDKSINDRDEREELLFAYGEQVDAHRSDMAQDRDAKKADKAATKAFVAPIPVFVDHTEAFDQAQYYSDKRPVSSYNDHTEAFNRSQYDQEKNARIDAAAQARAEEKSAKAAMKADHARKADDNKANKYTTAVGNQNLKSDQKSELAATAKADKKERKNKKANAKAEKKAAKIAARSVVVPVPVFVDHTEQFDKATYDAEKQAIVDAEVKAKADAAQAKADKKSAKAQKTENKRANAYDKRTGANTLAEEQGAEMLSHSKADKKERKAQKAEAKAEKKAAKIAARSVVVPMPIFGDHTEQFDKVAYDADKQAIADAEAKVKADAAQAKADAKSAKAEKKAAKVERAYDKTTDEQLTKADKKSEMLSTNKQAKSEHKDAKAEAKAEKKAAKIAARSVVVPMPVFGDFTEQFDKAAYDADKQAIADAEAKVKADAAQAKADKKSAKAEAKSAKAESAYDKATDEQLTKADKKSEMLSTNKQAKSEHKEAKAEAKAEKKAAKIAARSVVVPMPVFGDFTEQFDKAAYDADKQAIADAEAKVKADAAQAKADAKSAKAEAKTAKAGTSYDKATDEQLTKMERKSEMLSTNKQATVENKERKVEAKAEKKAAKIAAKSVLPPVVLFGDFTENFDKTAYDADKQAIADAEAKAKADKAALKLEKKAASEAKEEAKISTAYDKATGEQLGKMERKSEMLSTNEQATAENKERKAEAKAEKKAAKLAAKSVLPPVVLFGDFTENFDQAAYDADKQAIADAEAKAKAEKAALKLEKKAASEAKEEAKISTAYDKATGEQLAKMERKAEYAVFLKQADEDKKQVKAVARAKAEAAKVVPVAIPETNYNDPELLPVDRDAEELEEAAKLQRAIENAEKLEGKKEIKLASRNQKDLKATEKLESKYANAEMLEYASQYKSDLKKNKKQLAKAEERGKFMLEYGSTYDPEWDGEFNNYGLPKVDPYTAGIKLSTSRQRSQKREKLSNFDEKKLSSLSRMQCDTDNQMIAARVHSQFADLELEVAKAEQDFSGEFRNGKEKRWLRENKKKLKSLKARVAVAEKYERLDNERYYSVVATNFEKAELHARADRDDLIAMREELMRLLDIRDEINAQLIQLYTGAEKGDGVNHIRRRNRVVLKARKRAHAKYRKYYNALNKYRVTRNEKMRIFDKLDEIVERSGDLAKAKYILRKEKPIGKARREYVREKGNAKSNIRYAKRYVNRFTAKAVRRAKRRQRRTRALIATLVLLAILGVAAFTIYLIGPQLLEAVKPKIPANFHQYIDKILSMWPRR